MGQAGSLNTWTRSTYPGCGGFCEDENGRVMFWPVGYRIFTIIPEPVSCHPSGANESRSASTASASLMTTAPISDAHTTPTTDISPGENTNPTTVSSLRRRRSEDLGSEQSQPGGSVAKKPKVLTKPVEGSSIATGDGQMTQGTTSI